MFSTLRNRFGIPGVISVIALVFAMFGGAYAASNSSGGDNATASAKAKKGPRGPKGATGPAGPAGPAGLVGPAGAKGDAGANGTNGVTGATGNTGVAGTSVTNTKLNPGDVNCPAGGAEFKVGAGTPTRACNGVTGFTKTLPSGETETGTWSYDYNGNFGFPEALTSISFPIPLASGKTEAGFVLNEAETVGEAGTGGCTGSVAEPTAPKGVLCVYTAEEETSTEIIGTHLKTRFPGAEPAPGSYGKSGAFLTGFGGFVSGIEPGTLQSEARGVGTWAVTAP